MKPLPNWLKIVAALLLLCLLYGAARLMITLDQGISARG